ncbi:hypothetical protein [Paenibacillus sp. FSL H3-0310]
MYIVDVGDDDVVVVVVVDVGDGDGDGDVVDFVDVNSSELSQSQQA